MGERRRRTHDAGMFGYFIAALGGLLLLVVIATAFFANTHAGPRLGKKEPSGEKPVGPSQPAADAPTPARSVTASQDQIDSAREHTPPA